jgi:hypothetical protein
MGRLKTDDCGLLFDKLRDRGLLYALCSMLLAEDWGLVSLNMNDG